MQTQDSVQSPRMLKCLQPVHTKETNGQKDRILILVRNYPDPTMCVTGALKLVDIIKMNAQLLTEGAQNA